VIGCYAKIAREDYPFFRGLVARKEKDRFEFEGWEGQDIKIGPTEFLAWCEARGQQCTRHNLDLLATEKWLQQSR
jgi:hypothetical protein